MYLKFLLFYLIWRITGNPFLAIIVLLIIFYFVDRRYIGLLPSLTRPVRRWARISNLHKQIQMNPHDMPARLELARSYIETRKYQQALRLLENISHSMEGDVEVLYEKGVCFLALGQLEEGEQLIRKALECDERIGYGDPYLQMATAFAQVNPQKALSYLEEFQKRNFSSCESYYRLALLQASFGNKNASRKALEQCLQTYRGLPRFRKRTERRWAALARLRIVLGG